MSGLVRCSACGSTNATVEGARLEGWRKVGGRWTCCSPCARRIRSSLRRSDLLPPARDDRNLRPFRYDGSREARHTDAEAPCAHCGRAVPSSGARHFVHAVAGGAAYGGPEDTSDPGDMGWFPVGADCARRLRRAGVHVQTTEDSSEPHASCVDST